MASGRVADNASGLAEQVQDALEHLHDPTHLQTHPLARLAASTQTNPSNVGKALRLSLEVAVEALRPTLPAQAPSRDSRAYEILRLRYLEALDVKAVLNTLALGRSEYYRDHKRALEAVTGILREHWGVDRGEVTAGTGPVRLSLRVVATPPNNLPLQLTSFIGREREIAEVKRLLGTTRLLTLTGTGGCGKTRLAYQVAADLLHGHQQNGHPQEYPDGVWITELAALSDPELVHQAVASALGLRDQPGRALRDALVGYLGPKHLLIILDNCEHLVDACAQLVETLLLGSPSLRVLATSREMLGVPGEVAWPLPPLDAPDPRDLPSADRVVEYGAVRLFVDRALLVQPSFQVTDRNASALAEIASRLDGIPLAIELAAARTKALSVEQIARHLDDRFGLLTAGSRTAPRRQQTLRETIDWSYDLLSEAETMLFCRLAVFSGGCMLEAAEGVCGPIGQVVGQVVGQVAGRAEPSDVLALLLRLVDRSLVVVEPEAVETRYRLLETIRQYAWEKLLEKGQAEAIQRSHADHYLRLAEGASPELIGPDQREWLDRLSVEHDNLRAALSWYLEHDQEAGIRLGAALWWFWYLRGHYAEGHRWLEALLSEFLEPTHARARVLLGSGVLGLVQGAGPGSALSSGIEVGPRLEESLAAHRAIGDRVGVAQALAYLGQMACGQAMINQSSDQYDKSRSLLEESLAIYREVGDVPGKSRALCYLGWLTDGVPGDWRHTRELYEEGLRSARRIGDWPSAVYLHHLLANLLLCYDGDAAGARSLWAEGIALAREIGDRAGTAWLLGDLGNLEACEGDYSKARPMLEQSLREVREVGDSYSLEWRLLFLANLLRLQGDWAEARTTLEECLAVCQVTGDRFAPALVVASLGNIARAEGEPDRARSLLGDSLSQAVAIDCADLVGHALWLIGILNLQQGAHASGAKLVAFAASHEGFPTLRYSADEAECDVTLATARVALGEEAFAQAYADGQAMTLEQAVEYALGQADEEQVVV